MRDLLLLTIVCGGGLYALRRPWVGMLLWTWLSVMNPHQQWGYATASMPLAMLSAIATLVGLLATNERRNPLDRPASLALLAFVVWLCITLPFSIYLDQSLSLFERSMKIYLMVFVTIALIDTRQKLDLFIWVCAISVGIYGIKGGLFTIATAGNYRVWGPGGFIGGNNEIAVAIIMVIPLFRYLQLQQSNVWLRRGLVVMMALCAVTAIGTYSRGALLAICAMGAFMWLKSRGKLLGGLIMVLLAVVILASMPEHWWERMRTIQTYQEDDSALGRLNAWTMAWNLAWDRFFGGGFMIYKYEVFAQYSPDPERIHAAHSIYFQVLGEHGFVGLGLFMLIGALTWYDASRLISLSKRRPEIAWAGDLGRMIHVSMIGFAVGGAFLSLAYFDLPYNIMAMAVSAVWLVQRVAKGHVGAGAPPPAPASPPTVSGQRALQRR